MHNHLIQLITVLFEDGDEIVMGITLMQEKWQTGINRNLNLSLK